ncbi:MAG: LysR family transcriptional regulator [Clostridia bacterium]|nr:LysR family transcriptional regulator [Clostridia bacterium]
MDLRSLNTFIQVAESKSFTRAGDKLGYSQPTVSLQIKQLESELGVRLFDRIGHTVTLTDSGRQALHYAQQICRVSGEMLAGMSGEAEPSGTVRLAMADSLCTPLIVKEFANFRRKHPNVSLSITTAGTDELFRLLNHNETDVVCTLDNHIYNSAYKIIEEEVIGVHFVCSADCELANEGETELDRLLEQPFLLTEKGMSYRRLLDERLAAVSREIAPVLEFGNADLLCRLTGEGAGVSFLPDYVTERAVAEKRLVRLNVKDFEVELWKQVICRRDKWVTLQMQTVMDYLSAITLG